MKYRPSNKPANTSSRVSSVLLALVILVCIGVTSSQRLGGSMVGRITRGPGDLPPTPPLGPVNDLPSDLFQSGDYFDLRSLGGPALGISNVLLQSLQATLNAFFNSLGGALGGPGFPEDLFFNYLTDKWTSDLVKFKYGDGLKGFLDYFYPGDHLVKSKLTKAACTIYPWTPALPPPVKMLKDQYCIKAIPQAILSQITSGKLIPIPPPLPFP